MVEGEENLGEIKSSRDPKQIFVMFFFFRTFDCYSMLCNATRDAIHSSVGSSIFFSRFCDSCVLGQAWLSPVSPVSIFVDSALWDWTPDSCFDLHLRVSRVSPPSPAPLSTCTGVATLPRVSPPRLGLLWLTWPYQLHPMVQYSAPSHTRP